MLKQLIEVNQETKNRLNATVIANYSKLKLSVFLIPFFLLAAIVVFLYSQDSLSVAKYVAVQKNLFLFLNGELSQFPTTIYNLTQVGDALVFLSLLTIFIVYAPKLWEALLTGSIVSAIFSNVLKNLFKVPRPAEAFDRHSFVIVGRTMPGFSSLPSGHSITVFTILTIVLLAFMPKKGYTKILWSLLLVVIGLMLVVTRVGVGAHHPLDVLSGSSIGVLCGLLGIFISRKYNIWGWIATKKFAPFFIVLLLACSGIMIERMISMHLIVFYLTFVCLVISLSKIIYVYIKK